MEDTEIISMLFARKESALDEITDRYGRMLKKHPPMAKPSMTATKYSMRFPLN